MPSSSNSFSLVNYPNMSLNAIARKKQMAYILLLHHRCFILSPWYWVRFWLIVALLVKIFPAVMEPKYHHSV